MATENNNKKQKGPPKGCKSPNPKGRPSGFTPELGVAICEWIAEGESLRKICEDEALPSRSTVVKWLGEYSEFSVQYARAREAQADYFADEMIEIADLTKDPQKARLQIDARKWKASKMSPKKYGDKVVTEHTGKDGGPIDSKWTVEFVNATPEGQS